jgi:hypothetical protein
MAIEKWTGRQAININVSNVYSSSYAYIWTVKTAYGSYNTQYGIIDDYNKSTTTDYNPILTIKTADSNTASSGSLKLYTGDNLYNSTAENLPSGTSLSTTPSYTQHTVNVQIIYTNNTGGNITGQTFSETVKVYQKQNKITASATSKTLNFTSSTSKASAQSICTITVAPKNCHYRYVNASLTNSTAGVLSFTANKSTSVSTETKTLNLNANGQVSLSVYKGPYSASSGSKTASIAITSPNSGLGTKGVTINITVNYSGGTIPTQAPTSS